MPRGFMEKWINLETRWTSVQISRTGRCSPVQRATCTNWREVYVHPRVSLDVSGENSISSSCRKINLVSSVAQPWPNHYTECAIRDSVCYIKQNKERFFQKLKRRRVLLQKLIVFQPFYQFSPFFYHHRSYSTDCTSRSLNHRWTCILSQYNKFRTLTTYFLKIRLSIFPHLHPCLQSYLFPSVLTTRSFMQARMGFLRKAEGSEIINAQLCPSRHRTEDD